MRWLWARRFLKLWKERKGGPSYGQVKLGMIFSLDDGEVLTNQSCIDITRLSLSDHVENIEEMNRMGQVMSGAIAGQIDQVNGMTDQACDDDPRVCRSAPCAFRATRRR